MGVRFACRLIWIVSCSECGKDSFPQWCVLPAGDTVPHPTLPDGWINLGDRGVVCPLHTVVIGQRP